MKVVSDAYVSQLVGKYVSDKVGLPITNTPFVGFAIYNSQDEFVAGVVVSNFRGTDCEVSMAAETPNWARRGVMQTIFDYIFNTAGCVRCTCIVKNARSTRRTRRFLLGIGFELEGNLKKAYDGTYGALLFGLLRENCRFLKELDVGQENRTEAAASARSQCGVGGANQVQH